MRRWFVGRLQLGVAIFTVLTMLLTACGTSSGDKTATAGGNQPAKPTTAAPAVGGAATTVPTTGAGAATTASASTSASASTIARPAGTTPAGSSVAAVGASPAASAPSGTSAASSAAAPAAPPPAKPVPQPVATGLGSEAKPITMYFVPSEQVDKVLASGNQIAKDLETLTGLKFKTAVPTSYGAVIESMGSGDADIAWLATFAYLIAHQKYNANVALTTVRNGLDTYKGEIITRSDSGITDIKGCNGKTMAWVDAASTSGYIFPSALFAQQGIKPSKEIFAGGHPQAVLAVYQGNADCAATYYSPNNPDGTIADGRATQLKTYPDIITKVKAVGFTPNIPNDTVTFRKDFPKELQDRVVNALLYYISQPDGKKNLGDLYSITGLVKSDDSRYQVVRDSLKALGKDPSEYIK
ncbi:MAG: phosphate/phosphite/phosphonate ABC transporter substrate-binding protein [Thermomicrobia bacterium]|nr:phosphate/phosphite/phosphonate ABC transporter substrate-binding protein [Thermomicrobia bacterium]